MKDGFSVAMVIVSLFFIYFLGFLQGYSNGHKNGKIDTLKEYIVELNNKDK